MALPEDQVRHVELIDGRLRHKWAREVDGEVVVAPPAPIHQLIVGRLFAAVDAWIGQEPLRGVVTLEPAVPIGVRRSYLPDVAWYPVQRCSPAGEPLTFQGVPALVVEVLSPSNSWLEVFRKRSTYARVGVDEVWLLDPGGPGAMLLREASGADYVTVTEVAGDDDLGTPLLPGFAVSLGSLVRR